MNHLTVPDHYITASAFGAIASPLWLPSLHTVSATAAEVAPILGCLWLLVQIGIKVYDYTKKHRFREEIKRFMKDTE